MNSSLCLGWVSHRRLTPRRHAFRYRIGMFYLDLDEQTWLLKLSLWLGRWRLAPLCWRETDYLPALTRQGEPLAQAARLLVHQATGHMPEGPVRLLTQLRCWGLSFNPVSFYFCHDRDGRLAAILLEVRNTPWRERFHYVLPVQGNLAKRFTVAKAFHVSPFMPLDMDYHLRFSLDAAHVRIHMQNWQGGRKVFEADLTLQRQPLDAPALRRYVLTFPWMSLHTVLAIYWQALRLLFKRTPVHDHTTRQGDLALGQPCEDLNMSNPTLSVSKFAGLAPLLGGLARSAVLAQMGKLRHGHLRLLSHGQQWSFGDAESLLQAEVEILDDATWSLIAGNGSIGAGEAYIHGYWRSPDLALVTRLFVANLEVLDALEGGLARFGRPALRLLHRLNRNSRRGARRNILAHYDLGNALFERLLDPTMMYSAAQFEYPGQTLEHAQLHKLERICQKLELRADDHLLEIGCGWGSLAIHAATRYGCRVTTTTLSEAQYAHTLQRVQALGLAQRVTVLREDYRDLQGSFDKLVSIEMIEAVGHRYLPVYFRQCASLLKPEGLMLLQAITIRDQRYAQARRSVDFIQRYIFPGGALPSLSVMLDTASRQTALNLVHLEDFGLDYAHTLQHWRENLRQARTALMDLGYDDMFQRLWEFYLCYCQGGFEERAIGVAHLLWAAPQARRALAWQCVMRSCWLVANALWLQAGWWACVLGAQRPWLLLLVPLGLAVHLRLCPNFNAEGKALWRVALAGCLLDSVLGVLGVFGFDAWPLPLWLALLWWVLASGMRHSLAWAGKRYWLGALLGAFGGPLAYVGGARLADVALPLGTMETGLLLMPVWALALPLLSRLAASPSR